ncbi:hypothetical protein GCM10011380_24280 [Sphingomonas metalli]|uniref:Uncharacterized protein n=1 Tax=Sphingomonas metalli TaxID=1779358 RepID=A0A916WVV2_9SPHN|nr:hypothetical protein [Sphingomonas metalli]GGB33989.1 hypothetical protein GCM10011380_24280 [Sphingomonas metalli]
MRILSLTLLSGVLLATLPGPAGAQVEDGAAGRAPQRVRSIMLEAGQACPKAEGDEIVVCRPAEEPYRIPKQFRRDGPIAVPNQSWVNRAADIDQTSRVAGGLPNTCSPIGTGGQTGCSMMWLQQWAAERRAQKRADESVP